MKPFVIVIFSFLLISCNSQEKRKPVGKSKFQQELNKEFKDASTSPLTKNGLKKFKGLDFFPIQEKYKITAQLKKTPNGRIFEIPTTTERVALYKQYGILTFSIDSKKCSLKLYKSRVNLDPEYRDHLFLPFLDKTNGKNSYAGGRFIDLLITEEKNGTIEIDFNKAYNPYCAYSDRYSCPVTPRDNYLDIEISAGVMNYKK